jgi:RNA polymerase sigma-70 factor, ECF subfamily
VHGAQRVARNLLHYWGPHATLVSHPVGGDPALLGFIDRRLAGFFERALNSPRVARSHRSYRHPVYGAIPAAVHGRGSIPDRTCRGRQPNGRSRVQQM